MELHGDALLVYMVGYFEQRHAQPSLDKALALVGSRPFHIVAELLELQRYDSAARMVWQRGLLPLKGQLKSIRVASTNRMVSMGATVVGMALGMHISKFRTQEDLLKYVAARKSG